MTTTLGSLFTGYAGLELALQRALGTTTLWHVENNTSATKVLDHHWGHIPNLGDATKADWTKAPPVDVLTGGTPCQDLSSAGHRQGMREGTRSNLWVQMRLAIQVLQPRLVVWENVQGALSAPAHSDVEPCQGCVGDGPDVTLRALGRVLGDLAELRYDARWIGLRAADVGAPHNRFRIFLAAKPTHLRHQWPRPPRGGRTRSADGRGLLLPTPVTTDAANTRNGTAQRSNPNSQHHTGTTLLDAITLLPTPAVNDMGDNKTVQWWDDWCAKTEAVHHNRNGHGKSLGIEVRRGSSAWGEYAEAIARWENLTRPAPPPTALYDGEPRLNPRFSEWMMGLPAGHVTDVPGLSRGQQLKILGNGVVPQQAEVAITALLGENEDGHVLI